jgi:single-strand DNA-binding protein
MTVALSGNLTATPELRYTPSGVPLAKFGLAVNRRYQKDGEWEESTSFFNVVCWRELAERVSESLEKGNRAIVVGRLEQRSWETDQGDRRSTVEIVADDVGPSLKFANADVAKVERTGPQPTRDAGRPTPSSPADKAKPGAGKYDEEPF